MATLTQDQNAQNARAAAQAGTWIPMVSGGTPRWNAGSALLTSGIALVAGGEATPTEVLDSSEAYYPEAGAWTPTGNLQMARKLHTVTLLPNGKVLVVGGTTRVGKVLDSAELYEAVTGTWTSTGHLGEARQAHTATLLADGTVLVVGGVTTCVLSSAEIYNPATGAWTSTGSMGEERWNHTATLLRDGRVLVAGGLCNNRLPSAEIYNPATGTWASAGNMGNARDSHTATLLQDGKVLVAGGCRGGVGNYTEALSGSEIYDPVTGTWTPTGDLGTGRYFHTATLLLNGKVLVAGGRTGIDPGRGQDNTSSTASAEIYDPLQKTWTPIGDLHMARFSHTATRLNDGTVMVAFGQGGDAVTEVYVP